MSDKDENVKFKSGKWNSYENKIETASSSEDLSQQTNISVLTIDKEAENNSGLDGVKTKAAEQNAKGTKKRKAKHKPRAKAEAEPEAEKEAEPEPEIATEPETAPIEELSANIEENADDESQAQNIDKTENKALFKNHFLKLKGMAIEHRSATKEEKQQKKAQKAEQKEKELIEQKAKEELNKLKELAEGGDKKAKAALARKSKSAKKNDDTEVSYTLEQMVYRWCYYIGVEMIRQFKNYRRRLRVTYAKTRRRFVYKAELSRAKRAKSKDDFARSVTAPFREVRRHYNSYAAYVAEAKKTGGRKAAAKAVLSCFGEMAKNSKKAVRTIFNYVFPTAAVILLVSTVLYFQNLKLGLSVEYAGKNVGFIENESVFENARKKMMERIVNEAYVSPADTVPKFKITVADQNQTTDVDTLADEIIGASGNVLEQADGLYVGGRFVGAVKKGDALLMYLDSILEKHRTHQSDEIISFIKDIKLRKGLYPVSSVVPLSDVQQRLQGDDQVQRVYTAVKGDSPSTIAEKNGIAMAQLKQLNPDIEKKLVIGQQVLVSQSVPFLGVKVTRTEEYTEETDYKTDTKEDNRYYVGYSKVIKKGIKGEDAVKSRVTYIDGQEVDRVEIDRKKVSDPVNEVVVKGTQKPLSQLPSGSSTSGSFLWPVDGGRVSCGINGYRGHTGMDIAGAPIGTGIRASKAGRVVMVSYAGAYGRHIMIDHGNGVQTLYAHNSQLFVQVGQYVEQGQLIAALGRTGRVTGPHLHFEIRINGRYMNPANYIG